MTRKRSIEFRLYLITDRALFPDTTALLRAVEMALRAGVKAVQLREKDLPTRPLLDLAHRMRELTSRFRARLFINDRADIALCTDADGVHLGQSSMPPSAVRGIVGERMLIGVSTHGVDELAAAEREGADFVTYGPLYATPSKLRYGAPVGVGSLKEVIVRTPMPVFGIGGIKKEMIKDVMASGAHGVALISGILGVRDITSAAEQYLNLVGERV